jgi:UDP-2,3-diacylglucosamine hydrolase
MWGGQPIARERTTSPSPPPTGILPSLAMPEKPILLTSDVHLGVVPRDTEDAFRRWLDWSATEASQVVLNGDIFDFWFEYRSAVPRGHTRVLGAIAAVVDSGVPVTMMGGNHDWWGGDYLRSEIGVEFLTDPVKRHYAGLHTLLAHGDGVGAGDLGYRLLKLVLRGRLTIAAFRLLHPDIGAWIARRVSQTDQRLHVSPDEDHSRVDHVGKWGRAQLADDPSLDLVVLGHTHTPLIDEVEPGRWYVNAGDWVANRTYLRLSRDAPPTLLDWDR